MTALPGVGATALRGLEAASWLHNNDPNLRFSCHVEQGVLEALSHIVIIA